MDWIKRNAGELLPIVIAIVVPLAGLLLAAQEATTGDRRNAARIGAACVLGVFLWLMILTA
jgi:threonine/homoserine/homoserine lactone efflux protein